MFLVQASTFLCFQARRSSAKRSSAYDLTVNNHEATESTRLSQIVNGARIPGREERYKADLTHGVLRQCLRLKSRQPVMNLGVRKSPWVTLVALVLHKWECCPPKVPETLKVARNEVENASFAQRSAHRDSRIWRPELIEPAAKRKRRARGRRPTFKSAYPDPQILSQCNISSNYPL